MMMVDFSLSLVTGARAQMLIEKCCAHGLTTPFFEYACDDTDGHMSQLCAVHDDVETTQWKQVRVADGDVTTHDFQP